MDVIENDGVYTADVTPRLKLLSPLGGERIQGIMDRLGGGNVLVVNKSHDHVAENACSLRPAAALVLVDEPWLAHCRAGLEPFSEEKLRNSQQLLPLAMNFPAATLKPARYRDEYIAVPSIAVGERRSPSKSEQPERDGVAAGLFFGAGPTGQAAGSGSGFSFLRERRSLA